MKRNMMRSFNTSYTTRHHNRRIMASASQNDVREAIEDYLNSLNGDRDFIFLWNKYCKAINHPEDMIYMMYEFDALEQNSTPLRIVKLVQGNHFNYKDYLFMYTNRGVESFRDVTDIPIVSISDMADYIIRNNDTLDEIDIEEILYRL